MTRPVLVLEMAGLTRRSVARVPRLAALRATGFEARWEAEPGPRPWWEASGRHGGRSTVWVVGPGTTASAADRADLSARHPAGDGAGTGDGADTGESADRVRRAVTAARQLLRTCRPGLALVRLPFPAGRPLELDRLIAPLLDDARDLAAAVVVIGAGRGAFALCSERRATRDLVSPADVPDLLAELARPDLAPDRHRRTHPERYRCPWCTVRRTPADLPGRTLR
ncbi:hypothetical protein [Streptomyces ziwulingensis]|uniref:Uncharacterized protein n=1 Tax=Streptomyces ziwulingensis TaxID=1045501 RepID=A0ABP9BVC6_9ACTN